MAQIRLEWPWVRWLTNYLESPPPPFSTFRIALPNSLCGWYSVTLSNRLEVHAVKINMKTTRTIGDTRTQFGVYTAGYHYITCLIVHYSTAFSEIQDGGVRHLEFLIRSNISGLVWDITSKLCMLFKMAVVNIPGFKTRLFSKFRMAASNIFERKNTSPYWSQGRLEMWTKFLLQMGLIPLFPVYLL